MKRQIIDLREYWEVLLQLVPIIRLGIMSSVFVTDQDTMMATIKKLA
jgi:hypothetical protein